MKTFVTLTAAAALIAGMSIASAQNAPSTTPNASPNAINKGSLPSPNSGSESQATAKHKGSKKVEKDMNNKKDTTSGANPSSK